MNLTNFKNGIRDGIPIALSYFAVSFAFGIKAVDIKLSVFQAGLISLTNVTSAGQFAALDIILNNGSLLEMALTQLIINLRYCLMSLSVGQRFNKDMPFIHRFFVAFGMTDEIFGISISQKGKINPFYNYGAMSIAIPGWTIGTIIGAICGNILPDNIVSALNMAIYGMFLAIIIPPAKKSKPVLLVVIGAMLVSTLFKFTNLSSGFVIILTTLIVAGMAAYLFPVSQEENS